MSHWYVQPNQRCEECNEPLDHESHKQRCACTFSGFGPGFVFCELEAGHDGPHLLHPWDGSEWLVEADLTRVQTKPSRVEAARAARGQS